MRSLVIVSSLAFLAACTSSCRPNDGAKTSSTTPAAKMAATGGAMAPMPMKTTWTKPPADVLKKQLTATQWNITQEQGTEPPFENEYWNNHTAGLYVDVTTGEPLFSSTDKFDSGTGWPSFTRPLEESHIVRKSDGTHGMERVEARSKVGDAHLGHVFDDGPQPTGERWCINSASLRFIPATELEAQGYAAFLPLFGLKPSAPAVETAILSGGCFWGMQELLRKIPGVVATEVGYADGAEAVKITFRPSELPFETLLADWYFRMHDPTTKDRQGNDTGRSYRSSIFFTSDAQRTTAMAVKAKIDAAHRWPKPIVTEIVAAPEWKKAEDFHQDYLQKHPDGYTCHFLRQWN